MNLKFFINIILFVITLYSGLLANQTEDYKLIDNSYKNFLKENSDIKKEWYNKPCEYIDYLQKQFLKSENEEEGKQYAKLLKLALDDGLYFTYKKQKVPKDQLNLLSGLFQKAKVISNIGVFDFSPHNNLNNIYQKTFHEHIIRFTDDNFNASSWKGVKDPNYMVDNFWINLQNNISNQEEERAIARIKNLPLYQRDILPQYFLNKIMGCAKNQNYRILELFKKPLGDEYLAEILEESDDLYPTKPYFFYNKNSDQQLQKIADKNGVLKAKADSLLNMLKTAVVPEETTDDSVRNYEIDNTSNITIFSIDDLNNLNPQDKQKPNQLTLDFNLDSQISFNELKDIFNGLKDCNLYNIDFSLSFNDPTIETEINDFLSSFKNLYNLKLKLNNKSKTPTKIDIFSKLPKLSLLDLELNGEFDLQSLIQNIGNLEKSVNLTTLYLRTNLGDIDRKTYGLLAEAIGKNKNLKGLNFIPNIFTKKINGADVFQTPDEETIEKIANAFSSLKNLSGIDISCPIMESKQNILSIRKMLNELPLLQGVQLNFWKDDDNKDTLFDEDIERFANALGQKPNLEKLFFRFDHIGEQGSRAILVALQNFRNLKKLYLGGKILAYNHQDFLRAIGNNNKIKELDLEFKLDNTIQDENYLAYQQQFYNTLNQELSKLQNLNYLYIILPSIKQMKLEQIAGDDQNEYIEKLDDLLKNDSYKKLKELVYKLDKLSTVFIQYYDMMGIGAGFTYAISEDIKKVIEKRRIPIYNLLRIRGIFDKYFRKEVSGEISTFTYRKKL